MSGGYLKRKRKSVSTWRSFYWRASAGGTARIFFTNRPVERQITVRRSASLSPFARWESGELRGLADTREAVGERRGTARLPPSRLRRFGEPRRSSFEFLAS